MCSRGARTSGSGEGRAWHWQDPSCGDRPRRLRTSRFRDLLRGGNGGGNAAPVRCDRRLPASEQYTRSLIRSYIFVQLINIIDAANSGATLSSQDQGALTYLEGQIDQERSWTYLDAYAKYIKLAETQQNCSPGTGAEFADGSFGMGGFTAASTRCSGTPRPPLSSLPPALPRRSRPSQTPRQQPSFSTLRTALAGGARCRSSRARHPLSNRPRRNCTRCSKRLTELGQEVLSEVGTALFEMASDESGTAGMVIAAISLGLILASGIWNSVNATDTETALESNAATTPNVGPTDLAELTTGSGMPELLYVVLAQTLPSGTSIPSSASGTNSFPCSFDPSASYDVGTNYYKGCLGYTFASDPDYVASRYPRGSTAPTHTSSDPDFLLSQQGSSATTLSTTLQNSNTYLVPWESTDSKGNPNFYDQSSARDVGGISEGTNCNAPTVALGISYPPLAGYSSYIDDNMFVTSLATCGAGANGSTWLYNPGIRYVDWSGNWWVAWYQDGTFMHVKVANAIGGTLTPGNESTDAAESPCVENFSIYGPPFTALSKVGGPDCLFASPGANLNGLDGQSVLVDGQLRVVRGVVDCYQSTGGELIGIKSYCSPGDGTGNNFQDKAVYLQEGVSTDWTSISASEFVKILFDLPGTFSLGTPDPRAMALVGVDTCAGRTGCTGSSDFSNCYLPISNGDPSSSDCFVSPTIDYKASNVDASGNVSTQNWSATLAYPTAPSGTAPVVHGGYEGDLTTVLDYFTNSDPSLSASDFSATIDWGDGGPASDGTIQTLG